MKVFHPPRPVFDTAMMKALEELEYDVPDSWGILPHYQSCTDNRKRTYCDFPNTAKSADELASHGFYYTGK